jgi:hypothetical protein
MLEELALMIKVACMCMQPAVTAAWMSPDGTDFVLTGPEWTPALARAGARLSVDAQRQLMPGFEQLIEGGYEENIAQDDVPDWIQVYP